MTAQEFSFCSLEQQFELLNQEGVCLLILKRKQVQHYLYAVQLFYVEIIQDRHTGETLNLRSFDDPNQLDLYLSQIDITPVLNG